MPSLEIFPKYCMIVEFFDGLLVLFVRAESQNLLTLFCLLITIL